MILVSEADKAYAAGLVDGEGCLHIHRRLRADSAPFFSAVVQVAMVNRAPLDWLAERWGGSVQIHDMSKRPTGRRQSYSLAITTKNADRFLADIYPYLKVKKAEARMLRAHRMLIIGGAAVKANRLSQPLVAVHERIHAETRSLKLIG